ncbi:7069_t:CDS:2 [Ambispora gerdemannii]|uniref:7069_t:CDS:1 n=1 Tax=Ambispora gerdemannii TaxID=144530 RepID=A0A9N8WNV6_9GLOM|nr:7069_t:CDS:2 [Ambispora gerdemannii]
MKSASPIIAELWAKEPQLVKNEYKQKEIASPIIAELWAKESQLHHSRNTANTSNITMPNYAANNINVATRNFISVGSSTPDYSMMSLGYDCDHAESNTNMFSSTGLSSLDFNFDYPVLINVHISSLKLEDGVNQNDFFF